MPTSVLLLDEGTALAFVGVIAIVALCLLGLAFIAIMFAIFIGKGSRVPEAIPTEPKTSAPIAVTVARGASTRRRNVPSIKDVEIDVPTRHADAIVHALQAAGWDVRETGEVVATDEDEEGLTTISVDVPREPPPGAHRPSSGEEVH